MYKKEFVIFCFLYFLCPLHFFIIGEGNGYGIQGFLFRYQITPQGNSFISIINEIRYVFSGLIDGKSGFSIIFWVFGSFLFSLAFFLFLYNYNLFTRKKFFLIFSLMVISGICLLLSCVIQYGIFFNGPAGVSILIGLPFLMYFAWIFFIGNNQCSA
ncbi:hypothetical protein DK846_12005 [Methanospirillum lacunae]|uniref:Uncharacterized protein n=1 Tax=Methanospirillum lacunae TaxID=668570 RepID=A0A2V2N7N7_9EURY|nr:hypothetical protein DK846_12005 [Methanospirillum lacunae]